MYKMEVYACRCLQSGRRKRSTARASRVIDALPNIDYQMDFGTISDVESGLMDVYTFKAMLENSVKPIVHWAYNVKNVKAMVEMGVKVRGSPRALQENPLFIIYTESVTPLVHEFNALDISMTLAELEIPSIYTPAPQAGMSGPMTVSGTIVVSICESLSGLVCHQLVKEGAPFIMGGVITTMDMSAMQITYGSPEFNILEAGGLTMEEQALRKVVDLINNYQLPELSSELKKDLRDIVVQLEKETK